MIYRKKIFGGSIDRNNTNYGRHVHEFLKDVSITNDDYLRENQRRIHELFLNMERGFLIYWKMGSGKSRFAISAALSSDRDVIFLGNKSLVPDFKEEMDKVKTFLNEDEKKRLDNFQFVSLNASNVLTQIDQLTNNLLKLGSDTLEGKFIIIDEAHHLFNSITNMSKNAMGIYHMIKNLKDVKLLFLTGTPLIKSPFEMVPCFNMLTGKQLLPEDEEMFDKLFVADSSNRGKLMNRLTGLISYYEVKDLSLLPEMLKPIIERVHMSNFQFKQYRIARDIELEETKNKQNSRVIRSQIMKVKTSHSSSYRSKSRQRSNIAFPSNGKVDFTKINWENISDYSPKFERWYNNIKEGQLSYSYSSFINYGVIAASEFLKFKGWSHVDDNKKGKKFALITGAIDVELRRKYVAMYNDPNNLHGEILAHLLITKTGAEGFDFKASRQCHILEYFWHESMIKQVSARGSRLGSHLDLPVGERNIQIIIYLSVLPEGYKPNDKFREDKTTDEHIYEEAIKRQIQIDRFLNIYKEISVDCLLHHTKCRKCSPNNKVLFHDDISIDLDVPDPCKDPKEEKKKVKEVIIDGVKYYYDSDRNVIEFDKKLNGYVLMDMGNPLYYVVYNSID